MNRSQLKFVEHHHLEPREERCTLGEQRQLPANQPDASVCKRKRGGGGAKMPVCGCEQNPNPGMQRMLLAKASYLLGHLVNVDALLVDHDPSPPQLVHVQCVLPRQLLGLLLKTRVDDRRSQSRTNSSTEVSLDRAKHLHIFAGSRHTRPASSATCPPYRPRGQGPRTAAGYLGFLPLKLALFPDQPHATLRFGSPHVCPSRRQACRRHHSYPDGEHHRGKRLRGERSPLSPVRI